MRIDKQNKKHVILSTDVWTMGICWVITPISWMILLVVSATDVHLTVSRVLKQSQVRSGERIPTWYTHRQLVQITYEEARLGTFKRFRCGCLGWDWFAAVYFFTYALLHEKQFPIWTLVPGPGSINWVFCFTEETNHSCRISSKRYCCQFCQILTLIYHAFIQHLEAQLTVV